MILALMALFGGTALAASPCVIPVKVNRSNFSPELADTLVSSIIESTDLWNNANLGFRFEIVDWNWSSDRDHGAIVISTHTGPVNNVLAENTNNYNNVQRVMMSRLRVKNDNDFCYPGHETGCYYVTRTIAHELGHALGLRHVEDEASIMWYGNRMGVPAPEYLSAYDASLVKARFYYLGAGCESTPYGLSWGWWDGTITK